MSAPPVPRRGIRGGGSLPEIAAVVLVGAAASVVAEVAVGLLLYTGDGMLRALTVLLATLFGALALGFWSAPRPGIADPVEVLRRRWLLVLVAFTVGGATALAWRLGGGLAEDALRRGAGLALLAAFPLYAVGSLLGAIGAVRADRSLSGAAGPAFAGAAIGALVTGLFLVQRIEPVTTYLLGVVALSGAALLHGRSLDRYRPDGGGSPAEGAEAAGEAMSADGESVGAPMSADGESG